MLQYCAKECLCRINLLYYFKLSIYFIEPFVELLGYGDVNTTQQWARCAARQNGSEDVLTHIRIHEKRTRADIHTHTHKYTDIQTPTHTHPHIQIC